MHQGIPNIRDLTHPNTVVELLQGALPYLGNALLLVVLFGALLGLLIWSTSRQQTPSYLLESLEKYTQILRALPLLIGALLTLISSYLIGSTLANRYHHWEQQQVSAQTQVVEGYRTEQSVPRIFYEQPQTTTVQVYRDGKYVDVNQIEQVKHYLQLDASQIQVKIHQFEDQVNGYQWKYDVQFSGKFSFTNPLNQQTTFYLEAPPPSAYQLLEGFKILQNGQEIPQRLQDAQIYQLALAPGKSTQLTLSYRSQGDARWVFNANQSLLSNFQLSIETDFPQAQYASGILPTEMTDQGNGKRLVWSFKDNVAVENPFGVYSAQAALDLKTGVLPRLLLLSPFLLLGWLVVLGFSVRLDLGTLLKAYLAFQTLILALTYLSRSLPALLAWSIVGVVFLGIAANLGQERKNWLISGVFAVLLPLFGFLIPYTGLTLAVAGLASVFWLVWFAKSTATDS